MMVVTIYSGNAGDRNERGMRGAVDFGMAIAERCGVPVHSVGEAMAPFEGDWQKQLRAAFRNMKLLAARVTQRLDAGTGMVLTMGRCVATLPIAAHRLPAAAIIWFDAHGDSNIPTPGDASDMAYLGGMVITGAAGEWDTGFGGNLKLGNVVLVSARDLDPPEKDRINSGQIKLVPVGSNLSTRLKEAIGSRPAYIHLDCDVRDAGLLATENQVSGGLGWTDLHAAFEMLALCDVIGLEIAEYEAAWPDGKPSDPARRLAAIDPILRHLMQHE